MSFHGDVRDWHRIMGLVVRDHPQVLPAEDWARRIRLILEELSETATAQAAGDLEEFADGLADLAWVVLGTAVEAGIPLDAVWAEVQRSNMAKAGGKLDASGKLMKPPGWKPPDIRRALGNSPLGCLFHSDSEQGTEMCGARPVDAAGYCGEHPAGRRRRFGPDIQVA